MWTSSFDTRRGQNLQRRSQTDSRVRTWHFFPTREAHDVAARALESGSLSAVPPRVNAIAEFGTHSSGPVGPGSSSPSGPTVAKSVRRTPRESTSCVKGTQGSVSTGFHRAPLQPEKGNGLLI